MEKKYTKMRQSLLDDRVFFQSTLDKYEEEIAKQAKDIEHLQVSLCRLHIINFSNIRCMNLISRENVTKRIWSYENLL